MQSSSFDDPKTKPVPPATLQVRLPTFTPDLDGVSACAAMPPPRVIAPAAAATSAIERIFIGISLGFAGENMLRTFAKMSESDQPRVDLDQPDAFAQCLFDSNMSSISLRKGWPGGTARPVTAEKAPVRPAS